MFIHPHSSRGNHDDDDLFTPSSVRSSHPADQPTKISARSIAASPSKPERAFLYMNDWRDFLMRKNDRAAATLATATATYQRANQTATKCRSELDDFERAVDSLRELDSPSELDEMPNAAAPSAHQVLAWQREIDGLRAAVQEKNRAIVELRSAVAEKNRSIVDLKLRHEWVTIEKDKWLARYKDTNAQLVQLEENYALIGGVSGADEEMDG